MCDRTIQLLILKKLLKMEVRPAVAARTLFACSQFVRNLNSRTVTDAWRERWVDSTFKSDYGKFKLTAGDFYGDAEKDKGEC